jgi:hypothetical protein
MKERIDDYESDFALEVIARGSFTDKIFSYDEDNHVDEIITTATVRLNGVALDMWEAALPNGADVFYKGGKGWGKPSGSGGSSDESSSGSSRENSRSRRF